MSLNQLFLFFVFFIDGILIGFVLDFFRIWRKSFSTSDIMTYIQDAAMCLIIGIILLYSMFFYNNGEIRLYLFISSIIGFILYILLLSKLVITINVKIVKFIKEIVKFIINIILAPIKFIFKLICRPCKFLVINIKKLIHKTTIISQKISQKSKIQKNIKKINKKKDFAKKSRIL